LDARNDAAEIVLNAERRLGEMLAEMGKQKPGQYQQRLHHATVAPSLTDLGIENTQSHRWQLEAAVPEETQSAESDLVNRTGSVGSAKGLLAQQVLYLVEEHRECSASCVRS
jgi:hypothetical protein